MIMYEKLSQMKEMFAKVNWIVTETSEFLILFLKNRIILNWFSKD